MLGEFKLSKSISKFFGDAYELFQLGSSVVDALDGKDEDESGFIDNPDNINSRQYSKTGAYLGSQDHLLMQ